MNWLSGQVTISFRRLIVEGQHVGWHEAVLSTCNSNMPLESWKLGLIEKHTGAAPLSNVVINGIMYSRCRSAADKDT
jgi:hypothetical protein